MFVLAHLSDPHLAPLPAPRIRDLASKRVLGYVNWQRKRRAIHRIEVVDALTRDLESQRPDHVAVTGDLVNIALRSEFAQARAWLRRLGSPRDVTLVPGNHDAYVRAASAQREKDWGDYMRGDGSPADGALQFPFVRRRGPVALIGLSSAVPTAPLMATGRLGRPQIDRMARILGQLAEEGLFRVVLIHHPPLSGPRHRFKRLIDAADLRSALKQTGAELVVHGHDHVHSLVWLDGPNRSIPALGVPSASAAPAHDGDYDCAAYNLYRIERASDTYGCVAISRGYRAGSDAIVELARRELNGLSHL